MFLHLAQCSCTNNRELIFIVAMTSSWLYGLNTPCLWITCCLNRLLFFLQKPKKLHESYSALLLHITAQNHYSFVFFFFAKTKHNHLRYTSSHLWFQRYYDRSQWDAQKSFIFIFTSLTYRIAAVIVRLLRKVEYGRI